ncbi:MAG: methyltransferase domain-containing protein [Acidiferrobacterales bacterium]
MPNSNKYIMDDPREARRLEGKVNSADWINKYFRRISNTGNVTLDVGCGPGTLLDGIKTQYPDQTVVGIDISHERLSHSCTQNLIYFIQASGLSLPFPESSFDSIYTRFLLEYLPDRKQAIEEMYRVCKPGGKVLLQDLDGQLVTNWPIDDSLASRIVKIAEVLTNTGFDPFVGRKLFSMATASGLKNIKVSVEPYHLIAGTATTEQRSQWELKLDIAHPLIAKALGNEEEASLFIGQYLEYLDDPNTFTYSNIVTVVGTKPQITASESSDSRGGP